MIHGGILPPEEEEGKEDESDKCNMDDTGIEEQLDAVLKKSHGKGLDDIDPESVKKTPGGWELLYLVR